MEGFHLVHHHPKREVYLDAVGSALHCLCETDHIEWKEAYHTLIRHAASLGVMPHDRHAIRAALSADGFYLQAGAYANRPVQEIIAECNDRFHDGETLILNLFSEPGRGLYFPIVPTEHAEGVRYELHYPICVFALDVKEVWIRWKDRQDHSIMPRRKGGRKPVRRQYTVPEHEALVVHNENPTENLVGDCAVRAIAAVLEIPWEEAALRLAAADDYACTRINRLTNIETLLAKEGFEKHGPIIRNGSPLTGREFCALIHDMFQAGTRIIAFPGRHHAAAILVYDSSYKLVDTWDSSLCPITGYWAKYPARKKRPSKADPVPAPPEQIVPGLRISHKAFGLGTVTALNGGLASVRFDDGTEKKLSASWIQTIRMKIYSHHSKRNL